MRLALAVVATLALGSAAAAQTPSPVSLSTPVRLTVGQRLDICKAGLMPYCPVSRFICDDPKISTVEFGKQGAELVGVGRGFTRCMIHGHDGGAFRLLEITVGGSA